MEKKNGVLLSVEESDIALLKNHPEKFWEGVTKIGEGAFSGLNDLTDIVIPDTITEIGKEGFLSCENLKSVKMSDSVVKLGEKAFLSCDELSSVKLSENLEIIEREMFFNCIELIDIHIPDKVKVIAEGAFSECRGLKNIKFGKGLKIIEFGAFLGCESLESVELNEGLEVLAGGTFIACKKLRKVKLPESLLNIGMLSFSNCYELEEINLHDNIIVIGEKAFMGCKKLKNIKLPKKLEKLEAETFSGCEGLVDVTLNDIITEIRYSTFNNCKNLENIFNTENITDIADYAFMECIKLKGFKYGEKLKRIGEGAFFECLSFVDNKFPNSLEYIGNSAYYNCENIKSQVLPSSIKNIEKEAFNSCGFKYFTIDENGDKVLHKNMNFPISQDYVKLDGGFEENIDSEKTTSYAVSNLKNNDDIIRYNNIKKICEERDTPRAAELCEKIGSIDEVETFFNNLPKASNRYKMTLKLLKSKLNTREKGEVFIFANNIGCFSSDEKLFQKANEWFFDRVKNEEITLEEIRSKIDLWKIKKPNNEFSEFLFEKDYEKKTSNFLEIKKEKNWIKFLGKINDEYLNKNSANNGARRRNEKGKLEIVQLLSRKRDSGEEVGKFKFYKPTVEIFKKYFEEKFYEGDLSKEEVELANKFLKRSAITQKHFDDARNILNEFKEKNIPANIVGSHIKDEIFKYKNNTSTLAEDSLKIAEEVKNEISETLEKKFTFDWLEKNDTENFLIGLYCECCAHLSGSGYSIMKAGFIHPDVQNLVVKDKKENIIAKSTVYVNKKEGYAVFNNVEMQNDFLHSDDKVDIYKAYMRGVRAFLDEYNNVNKDNKIKKVTVGKNVNDLNDVIGQNHRFINLDSAEILKGLDFSQYGKGGNSHVGDWDKKGQFILYDEESLERE